MLSSPALSSPSTEPPLLTAGCAFSVLGHAYAHRHTPETCMYPVYYAYTKYAHTCIKYSPPTHAPEMHTHTKYTPTHIQVYTRAVHAHTHTHGPDTQHTSSLHALEALPHIQLTLLMVPFRTQPESVFPRGGTSLARSPLTDLLPFKAPRLSLHSLKVRLFESLLLLTINPQGQQSCLLPHRFIPPVLHSACPVSGLMSEKKNEQT